MRPRAGSLLAAAGVALAFGAGCGGDDGQGVRDAFGELRRAYLAQDYRALCASLSRAAKREIGELGHQQPTGCRRDVARNLSAAIVSPRDRPDPTIETISIDGDQATVTATLGGDSPGHVEFVREDGAWKLAQLFATTAPPLRDLR